MVFTKYKEGARAIRAIKYVAGKNTRARAPLAREYTNRIFESKDGTTSMKIVNYIERHNFCLKDLLTKSNRTEIQTSKVEERTLGQPVYSRDSHFKNVYEPNVRIMKSSGLWAKKNIDAKLRVKIRLNQTVKFYFIYGRNKIIGHRYKRTTLCCPDKSCLNKRLHSIFDISLRDQSPELTRMLPMTCTVLNHVFFYF